MRQPIASPLLMTLNLLNVDGLALRLSNLDAMLAALRGLAFSGLPVGVQASDGRFLVGCSIRKFYASALRKASKIVVLAFPVKVPLNIAKIPINIGD